MTPRRIHPPTPIYVFEDYQSYLEAWFKYARRFGITRKSFVEKAGIGAHAFMSDVLAGRKKIGTSHVAGIVKALDLNESEAEYFELLVSKENLRNPEEKEKVYRRLAELRTKNLSSVLADRSMEYFASWRYPVIREYVSFKGLVRTPKEIVRDLLHLRMSSQEVEQTLRKLQKWNMVRFDEAAGGWVPVDSEATIGYRDMPHAVVNDVKRAMVETSIHAMENMAKDERHVSLAIRGIGPEAYERFCARIDELRREFLSADVNAEHVDRVAALTVALFPVMRISCDLGHEGGRDAGE